MVLWVTFPLLSTTTLILRGLITVFEAETEGESDTSRVVKNLKSRSIDWPGLRRMSPLRVIESYWGGLLHLPNETQWVSSEASVTRLISELPVKAWSGSKIWTEYCSIWFLSLVSVMGGKKASYPGVTPSWGVFESVSLSEVPNTWLIMSFFLVSLMTSISRRLLCFTQSG